MVQSQFFDLAAEGHLVVRLKADVDPHNQVPWGKIPSPRRRTARDLYKFGKSVHLADALNYGRFRVATGSSYSDPSLNLAQNDSDEGRRVLRPSATSFRVVLKKESGGLVLDSATPQSNQILVQIGGDQDFYVWCCSKSSDPRLYADFGANACLVIHDLDEFSRRLNKALFAADNRCEKMSGGSVSYYDVLRADDSIADMTKSAKSLFFFKDFRYAYQAEYRFVWPLQRNMSASFLDIEVGPMRDICELLLLRASEGGSG